MTEVRWGHAPGKERSGEASCAEKAERLFHFAQENGQIDQLDRPVVVDLRPRPGITINQRQSPALPASFR
jgi:hypothetical protein